MVRITTIAPRIVAQRPLGELTRLVALLRRAPLPSGDLRKRPVSTAARSPVFYQEKVYTRRIMTSVDLMSAAAVCPFSRRISRAASAVMIDEIRCPPIKSFT